MKSNWRARFNNRKTSKERFTLLQHCKVCYSLRRGAIGQSMRQYTLGIDNQSPFSRYIAALDTLLDGVIAEYEKANSSSHEPSRVINVCQAMINNVIWLLNDRVAILYRGNNEQPITDTERIVFICLYHDMFQSMLIFYNTLKKLLCIQGSSIYMPSNSYSRQYKWLILSLKCHLNYSFPRLLYRVTSYNSTVVNAMVTMNTTKKSLQQFLCSKNVIQRIEDYKTCVLDNHIPSHDKEAISINLIQNILDPLYKLVQTFTATSYNSPSSKHQQITLPCCMYLMSNTVNSIVQQIFHIIYTEKCSINSNGVHNLFIFLLNLQSWVTAMKKGLGIGADIAVIADVTPWKTANSVIQLLQFPSRIKITKKSIWCCVEGDITIHATEETNDERKTEEIDDFTSNYDLNIKPTEKILWVKLRKGSSWQPSNKPEKVAVLFVVDVLNL